MTRQARLALSCLALPCLACLALPCLALPCVALPCLACLALLALACRVAPFEYRLGADYAELACVYSWASRCFVDNTGKKILLPEKIARFQACAQ